MNRQIVKTIKYKKDFKRVSQWAGFDENKLQEVLEKLCMGQKIDAKYRAHPMTNKKLYKGCMNLHLNADILLLYKLTDNELCLSRIGSHSQLLGNEKNNKKG